MSFFVDSGLLACAGAVAFLRIGAAFRLLTGGRTFLVLPRKVAKRRRARCAGCSALLDAAENRLGFTANVQKGLLEALCRNAAAIPFRIADGLMELMRVCYFIIRYQMVDKITLGF